MRCSRLSGRQTRPRSLSRAHAGTAGVRAARRRHPSPERDPGKHPALPATRPPTRRRDGSRQPPHVNRSRRQSRQQPSPVNKAGPGWRRSRRAAAFAGSGTGRRSGPVAEMTLISSRNPPITDRDRAAEPDRARCLPHRENSAATPRRTAETRSTAARPHSRGPRRSCGHDASRPSRRLTLPLQPGLKRTLLRPVIELRA